MRAPAAPAPLLSWARHARSALVSLPVEVPRAIVVGTAGAGKSLALRHLRALVEDSPRRTVVALDAAHEVSHVPADDVLLVDDLHLLPERILHALIERTADPAASLIATTRPWPMPPAANALVRLLERDTPPIVLGQVSRSDVLDHLHGVGGSMSEDCIDHVLVHTGGTAWLVAAALTHHDPRDCARDGAHRQLQDAITELVCHRLDTADDALRCAVERICVNGPQPASSEAAADAERRAFAEGLLLRGGDVAPVVRTAVRATMSARRLVDLSLSLPATADPPAELRRIRDPSAAAALAQRADRLVSSAAPRAVDLYEAAIAAGAPPAPIAERLARAVWATGDVEKAASLVDAAIDADPAQPRGALRALSAAVWSARGLLARADAVHRATGGGTPDGARPDGGGSGGERPDGEGPGGSVRDAQIAAADAAIAAFGVGRFDDVAPTGADAAPTTVGVAMTMLRDGLRRTLDPDADESFLADLVRAAELYGRAGADDAMSEPPAVVAAVVALNLGRVATAEAVLTDAVEHGRAGGWARRRLLLWRAWVAVQRARTADAAELHAEAMRADAPCSARDAVLSHAVTVGIARRQDDASALEAAWHRARPSLLRVEVDLFLVHPLMELVTAATALGDGVRVQPHLDRAFALAGDAEVPPVWSAHVHWAGVQQGILTSSPARLAPHAKALVATAARSRVTASMARAGRVWTEVLAGHVDAPAVIAAARALAGAGLMWDAARLAGHGAARCGDRRIAAQLLACARELHPSAGARRGSGAAEGSEQTDRPAPSEVLSEREIEVARLVLQGKTYAEVGATIFISPRTAEHHIAHIRRRLGVQTRSEMLARLRVLLADAGTTQPPGRQPP